MTENGAETATYTLQVNELQDDGPSNFWQDVATVTVAKRTNRTTAIRQAVKEAEINVETAEPPLRVRLLDSETAEPIELLGPAPAPGPRQLRI